MRILLVTSQFPIAGEPTRGRPIHQTARELAKLADVRVVSPVAVYPSWARPTSYLFKPADAADVGIDAEYVSYPALPIVSRPFNGWLAARAIAPALARFKPDVVLSYWLYPDAYGAMLVARDAGIPLVAGARGSDIRVRDRISKHLTRRVIGAADQLLVVSEDLGRLALSDYGADPARVHAIANGCDAATFHLADRAAARAQLRLDPATELVVYVGRLVAEKGLRELVGAMRDLVERRPGIELAMIGTGPLHDELAAEAARQTSLRIHLPGAQPPDAVARWMTASNVFALPSYSEGYPNVLVEALACGRPIVATPVGGIPEIVDAGSGILVAPRDVDALARGLAQALDRTWNEIALSTRFSRDWRSVALDTLRVCETAIDAHATTTRASTRE
jgi:teichuronic acid biosynthesis glycosyltransferase TuaC